MTLKCMMAIYLMVECYSSGYLTVKEHYCVPSGSKSAVSVLTNEGLLVQQVPLELMAHQEGKERGVWQVLLDRRPIMAQQS
jgi:hypothetical protein